MILLGVVDRTGTLLPVVELAARSVSDEIQVRSMGNPVDLATASSSADILMLGPSELTPTSLRRADSWRARHPASVLIGVSPGGGPTKSELRRLGVKLVIQGRVTDEKVATSVRQALTELNRLAEDASDWEPLEEPEPEELEDFKPEPAIAGGRDPILICIASPTGGSGKTFYAGNISAALAGAGHKVLLVDLDLQFGEVAVGLRLQHPYSIYDGLYDSRGDPLPDDQLIEQLPELVCRHEMGFDVLVAPKNPELADYVGAKDASRVLDAVLPRYEVVVADTPPSLNEVVLTVLDRSDIVAVLATPDVPSLKNLSVFLDTLRRLKIQDSHVRLILNKVERDIGLDIKEIQEAFSGRFVGLVPQSRLVSRALNQGQPVIGFAPKSDVSESLIESFRSVLPSNIELGVPGKERKKFSLLRFLGLGGRKVRGEGVSL